MFFCVEIWVLARKLAKDSDSRQKWEDGANMEGYNNLFIPYCNLFNDIHIAKWEWRFGILLFFDPPSVENQKC